MPELVFPPAILQSLKYAAPSLWIPPVSPDTMNYGVRIKNTVTH
ncbi:hypothetical protein [Alicyclobacillus sp. ALC3]|nr:hypothetical protein [Alicyclobacillus sp. ALC3]